MMHELPILTDFRSNPDATSAEQLREFLAGFGRDQKEPLPYSEAYSDRIELRSLIDQLPDMLTDGKENPARTELAAFYFAIDPRLRSRGAAFTPETLLSLLQERLEFFEQLARNLTRVCRGRSCPHFSVCRFKEAVADLHEEDGINCAVEREVIKHHVKNWVQPEEGQPKVDPRRPEMAFMFQQLMQLVILQVRYAMYMQTQDLLADHFETVRQRDGSEEVLKINEIEHPLLQGWQRTSQEIQKTMQRMGLTPEFQIRQDMWVEEGKKIDAEERALEIVDDLYRHELDRAEEGSPEHELLLKGIERVREIQEAMQ